MSLTRSNVILARLGAIAVLVTAIPAPAIAQTTVFSSLNGDGSIIFGGYDVSPSQWMAGGFYYSGPAAATLFQIRFAAAPFEQGSGIDASFWSGPTMRSASRLESWIGISGPQGLYSLTSAVKPILQNGHRYFLLLSTSGPGWVWPQSQTGQLGAQVSFDMGVTWPIWPSGDDLATPLPQFDVSVITPAEVVPEPATMTLLATGLAGMAVARRKKGKGGFTR